MEKKTYIKPILKAYKVSQVSVIYTSPLDFDGPLGAKDMNLDLNSDIDAFGFDDETMSFDE